MDINADFARRVLVHSGAMAWVPSPMVGVSRRMLDRIGGEVARATSVVRYDPGSNFSPHVHTGGEEFLVLEGVFQDEHGNYPAGTYIRNPPQSRHTPGSDPGCVILVKLWQFDLADRTPVCIETGPAAALPVPGRSGVSAVALHRDRREEVRLETWAPGVATLIEAPGGAEAFVVAGGFEESADRLERHSWLRVPCGGAIHAQAGDQGATVWIKTGHLRFVSPPNVT